MSEQALRDILKARDAIIARLKREREDPHRRNVSVRRVSAEEGRRLLDRFSKHLEAATRAKENTIRRYDEEIAYYTDALERIERSVPVASKRKPQNERDTSAEEAAARPSTRAARGPRKAAPRSRKPAEPE